MCIHTHTHIIYSDIYVDTHMCTCVANLLGSVFAPSMAEGGNGGRPELLALLLTSPAPPPTECRVVATPLEGESVCVCVFVCVCVCGSE